MGDRADEAVTDPAVRDARDGHLRIRARCECGGNFDGSSRPPKAVEDIYAMWSEMHVGPGHRRLRPGERRKKNRLQLIEESRA